jgi:phosphatidylglycerophosphate synthase
MDEAAVPGQGKHSPSLLSALDRRLIAQVVPVVPRSIRSHHLTLLTLLWSVLILACDALAVKNRAWLFAVSLFVAIQYVTDAIDGKLGVRRGDGLLRWGFYMDHLLDYVFLCSVLLGYGLLVPPGLQWLMMAILVVAVGFMVSSFLACAVEGDLGISYLRLGPVEIRLLFIGINAWLGFGGRAPLATVLPVVLTVSLVALCCFVSGSQRRLRRLDTRDSTIGIANQQSTLRESSIAHRHSVTI